jgi:hypothetical protein
MVSKKGEDLLQAKTIAHASGTGFSLASGPGHPSEMRVRIHAWL